MSVARTDDAPRATGARIRTRVRFVVSWIIALALFGVALPRAVDVSWHGVIPVLESVQWPAVVALTGLWLLGLYAHSFVLTAAEPRIGHHRALALNMTGSAVANVVPLGGAAGVELNRRMMKAWGVDPRSFAGYTFLTNVWDIGSKLLLPALGVLALDWAGQTVTPQLRTVSLIAAIAFVGLAAFVGMLLSPQGIPLLGRTLERVVGVVLRLVGRDRPLGLCDAALDVRRECAALVARGWPRMTAGIGGYVVLQGLLLGLCLHLTGADATWPAALAAFAVERLLTIVPITPGGIGITDIGLVGVLLALGSDPAGTAAAAVLYRLFIFAIEIPVGGGVLGIWLLRQRRRTRRRPIPMRRTGQLRRIAHVTDVFLPRLGGIETHVDELVRQQRSRGIDARVLTPTLGAPSDPAWVHRTPVRRARDAVAGYDVIQVHLSMWSPYGVSVARAAISAGIPTLVTVHSMWAGAGVLLRLAAWTSIRRWPVAWSAVSGAAADAFRRGLGTSEVAVLPNAIDVAAWRPNPTARTLRTPIRLVSVMRLMPRKRPMQLLAMFAEVRRLVPQRDVELVVVGDGLLRSRMDRYVRRHGLARHVRVTGHVPRDQVRVELGAASLYVAPAPKESFGIAALEARCVGLPVVAHRSSGVGEFIRDRVDGILVADDAEMVGAIAELVDDDAFRTRIANHNRHIAPTLDWSEVLDRTEALYERAAERAGVPGTADDRAPLAVGA